MLHRQRRGGGPRGAAGRDRGAEGPGQVRTGRLAQGLRRGAHLILPCHKAWTSAREAAAGKPRSAPPAAASAPATRTRPPAGACASAICSTPSCPAGEAPHACSTSETPCSPTWAPSPSTPEAVIAEVSGPGRAAPALHRRRRGLIHGRMAARARTSCSRAPRAPCSTSTTAPTLRHQLEHRGRGRRPPAPGSAPATCTPSSASPRPTPPGWARAPSPPSFRQRAATTCASRAPSSAPPPGRPRRCGWLDLVALQSGRRLNGLTGLAVTKLDVLQGFEEVKLLHRLRTRRPHHPTTSRALRGPRPVKPVYESLPGWTETSAGAQDHRRPARERPQTARLHARSTWAAPWSSPPSAPAAKPPWSSRTPSGLGAPDPVCSWRLRPAARLTPRGPADIRRPFRWAVSSAGRAPDF